MWWRNSAIYVAHCTNMKACWGRWKNGIFKSTSIICTLYNNQYLVIVLNTREYINRSGNERREKLYFSFLVMSYLIPLISERYGRPLTKILSRSHVAPGPPVLFLYLSDVSLGIWVVPPINTKHQLQYRSINMADIQSLTQQALTWPPSQPASQAGRREVRL